MKHEEIIFDFGFTAADEEEIFAPIAEKKQAEVANAEETAAELKSKLDKLYSAVQPLLQNLKANPEKPYIHWPNRVEKVDAFAKVLKDIYEG